MRLALFLLVPTLAFADAVDVTINSPVQLGKGQPSISVRINEKIVGFELVLTRSDGKSVDVKSGGKPGTTRIIDLPQPEGKFGYEGELRVLLRSGENGVMPLKFDAALYGPLKLTFDPKDLDLASRKVAVRLSRAADKVHLEITSDTGATDNEDIPFNAAVAGTPLEIGWPQMQGQVLRLSLRATDTDGFFTGLDLFPWQVNIPHEEVNFDTGKAEIRADQRAKLDQSAKLIAEAVEKFGRLAAIKLFVAGHTDTQGGSVQNRQLSEARARSIGAYFRGRGLRLPILSAGFGEEALAVQTPDETDEPRNRRAEYIIAIEHPAIRGASFEPTWRPL